MLKVTDNTACVAVTNLTTTFSPIENLTNGFNIGEQTCFHLTTVSHLRSSLVGLLGYFQNLGFLNTLVAFVDQVKGFVTGLSDFVSKLLGLKGVLTMLEGFVSTLLGLLSAARTAVIVAIVVAGVTVVGAVVGIFFPPALVATVVALAAGLLVLFIFSLTVLDSLISAFGDLMTLVKGLTPALDDVTKGLADQIALSTPALNNVTQGLNDQIALVTNTAAIIKNQQQALDSFRATQLIPTFNEASKIYGDAKNLLKTGLIPCWTAEDTANPGKLGQNELPCVGGLAPPR